MPARPSLSTLPPSKPTSTTCRRVLSFFSSILSQPLSFFKRLHSHNSTGCYIRPGTATTVYTLQPTAYSSITPLRYGTTRPGFSYLTTAQPAQHNIPFQANLYNTLTSSTSPSFLFFTAHRRCIFCASCYRVIHLITRTLAPFRQDFARQDGRYHEAQAPAAPDSHECNIPTLRHVFRLPLRALCSLCP